MIKLGSVSVMTSNIEEMKKFYTDVFEAFCDESHGGPDRCEIKFGDDFIVLCKTSRPPVIDPENCGMEFVVDDVDAQYERLTALGVKMEPPVTYPWQWRAIGFKDPDGNNIDFVQYVGEA